MATYTTRSSRLQNASIIPTSLPGSSPVGTGTAAIFPLPPVLVLRIKGLAAHRTGLLLIGGPPLHLRMRLPEFLPANVRAKLPGPAKGVSAFVYLDLLPTGRTESFRAPGNEFLHVDFDIIHQVRAPPCVNETPADFADSLQNGYKNAEVLLPPHGSISSMLFCPPGHIKRHENHGIFQWFHAF